MSEAGYKPVIKYVGGKTKLLPALLARLPARWNNYYEPFAGGAALFFRLQGLERRGVARLGDTNSHLITLYNTIKDEHSALIAKLKILETSHHASRRPDLYYLQMREVWNESRHRLSVTGSADVVRAATFMYLNRTCFNGLWRENAAGEMNTPYGKYDKPVILDRRKILDASIALAGTTLVRGDYRSTLLGIQPGDFAYLDPPYVPLTPTASFTSYQPGGFGKKEQTELAETVHDLVRRRCKVMLSNSDTPLVREIYGRYQIDRVMCGRSIAARGGARGKVGEVIVRAGY